MMLAPLVLAASLVPSAGPELPQGWVGLATCTTCHDETARAFVNGPHGRAMALVRGDVLNEACESCHGAGAAHAADPAATNIRIPSASSPEVPGVCANCHPWPAAALEMQTPAHQRAGVSCLACHQSGHRSGGGEKLLRNDELALCGSCHGRQRVEFNLPFAHRDGRVSLACTSCHSVHQNLANPGGPAGAPDRRCVNCHPEKRGPFVYPHPALEVAGCTRCHQPHGSPNPQLLVRHEPSAVCLECHTDTPAFHNVCNPTYRQCLACHPAVHGSQTSQKFFRE